MEKTTQPTSKLTDLAILVLADLNVAGDIGRSRERVSHLVSGSPGIKLGDVLKSLEDRDYITVVTPPSSRLIKVKHFITDHGREAFLGATNQL